MGSAKGLNCTCIANPTLGYHGNTCNMKALKCPGVRNTMLHPTADGGLD